MIEICKIVLPVIGAFAFGILLTLFMHISDERKKYMWFTKKTDTEIKEAVKETVEVEEIKTEEPKPDEWIWVEGYKATESDMTCRGYQYELGVQHDMPDEETIEECKQGFHLCKYLSDVFGYYDVCDGHRFFKVRALVRKSHYTRYGELTEEFKAHQACKPSYYMPTFWGSKVYDKMVAKSIIFEQELTVDEILDKRYSYVKTWDDKHKNLIIQIGIDDATEVMKIDKLVELGFSETFARHLVDECMYEKAIAVGSQPDLSMDMKCWLIFK